ncbi:MAG: hypothetical protein RLN70_05275, partial [Rhodospirillaceae bacterium]
MAAVRSPKYPQIDLRQAIEAMRPVFKRENRNVMPTDVLANHLGYSGVNGSALKKIGAVRAYGLIQGRGNEVRVSDDAIIALSAPSDAREYKEAISRCALHPTLFQDLYEDFEGRPSEENLKFKLIKMRFTEDAAGRAAQSFLSTTDFAGIWDGGDEDEENELDKRVENEDEETGEAADAQHLHVVQPPYSSTGERKDLVRGQANMRREVFAL